MAALGNSSCQMPCTTTGLAVAAVPLSRQPHGCLPQGSALLQSQTVTHGWFKQRCGRLGSHLAHFGPSGGAKGCRARRSGQRWSTALARAGRRDSCLRFCTANLASFACGQQWEGPHVIAYAHVFMHSVLLLVSQTVLSVQNCTQGRSAARVSTVGTWLIPQLCATWRKTGQI